MYFPPYHPDTYPDSENTETHCPENDLNASLISGQGLKVMSISDDHKTSIIFENETTMKRMVKKGEIIDGLRVKDIQKGKVRLQTNTGIDTEEDSWIILTSPKANTLMPIQPVRR